jgi:sugar lactone lactonase YvrE
MLAAIVLALFAACGKAPQIMPPAAPGIDARDSRGMDAQGLRGIDAQQSRAMDAQVSYPSSAVYDADSAALVVGSYADGSIRRVPVSHRLQAVSLPPLPQDGRHHVFRIRLDTARARIWVLASDAVYVYHSRTSKLLARIETNEISQHSNEHCLPDMAVDNEGNVFVSSAMQPRLMRIDGTTFEVAHRTLRPDAETDKDFGLSALAFAADGATLYAASATIGMVWKIDYAQGVASHIDISRRVFGACALRAEAPNAAGGEATHGALLVAGGFRGGVSRIDLSSSPAPCRVSTVNTKGAHAAVPTDFVDVDRRILIVSSRLSDHPDFDGNGSGVSRFSLVPIQAP